MAQRKLTPAQRTGLRKSIQKELSKKTLPVVILRSVAKRYSISTGTARWYLKSLSKSNGKPGKATSKGRTRRSKAKRATPRVTSSRSNGLRTIDAVRSLSRDQLRRALVAKDLVPKVEASRRRLSGLKDSEKTLRRSIRSVARQTRKLEGKLRRLTAR